MRTLTLDAPECGSCLTEIAANLRKSRRSAFVTGAGISCNAGIPDFRSKDGLYNLVKAKFPDAVVKGQELFDSVLFRHERTEQIFYSFMSALRDATLQAKPTQMHNLIRTMGEKGKLLRCYTQNIDGLEERAGVDMQRHLVKLHGDLHLLRCIECRTNYPWTPEWSSMLSEGEPPYCSLCLERAQLRKLCGRRTSSTRIGTLRPDIVLYGEDHPEGDVISQTLAKDIRRKPQLLVIAGTSLKVVGLKRLVKDLAKAVHDQNGIVVYINKTPASESQWGSVIDYQILCDSDAWVADVKQRIPAFFGIQTILNVKRQPRKRANTQCDILAEKKNKPDLPRPAVKKELYPQSYEQSENKFPYSRDENLVPFAAERTTSMTAMPPIAPSARREDSLDACDSDHSSELCSEADTIICDEDELYGLASDDRFKLENPNLLEVTSVLKQES